MAKLTYSTGINEKDTIICASKISLEKKFAVVGAKYSSVKDFNAKEQELSF